MELKLVEVSTLKNKLANWKPSTKLDAIRVLHFLSTLTANDKKIKEEAYSFLDNRCADCDIHEAEGLSVRKVAKSTELYNDDTPQMTKIAASIKALQDRYDALKKSNTSGTKLETHFYKKI